MIQSVGTCDKAVTQHATKCHLYLHPQISKIMVRDVECRLCYSSPVPEWMIKPTSKEHEGVTLITFRREELRQRVHITILQNCLTATVKWSRR